VLSRTGGFSHPGVEVFKDIHEAIRSLPEGVHPFIVGGSEIYRQTLALIDRIMLTRVLADIPGDASLAPWDRSGWELTQQLHVPAGPHDEYPTIFETWERRSES
jgi:dihydrofolate reductase